MPRSDDILSLPPDLPVPVDGGMARRLPGLAIAPGSLPATTGQRVDLSTLAGRTAVYCYPRTGRLTAARFRWKENMLASSCLRT